MYKCITARYSGANKVRVNWVSIRDRVRVRIRFMVWVTGKCPGGGMSKEGNVRHASMRLKSPARYASPQTAIGASGMRHRSSLVVGQEASASVSVATRCSQRR